MSRRRWMQYLSSVAAAAGTSALFPSISCPAASAQDGAPKRLLLFYTAHASFYSRWYMPHGTMPGTADYDYDLAPLAMDDFSYILQPLHRHRQKLLILDSLCNFANLSNARPRGHFGGPATIFTSSSYAYPDGDDRPQAGGPSLDQIVADHVAVPGRLRSLEYGGSGSAGGIWGGRLSRLPATSRASQAYERIFSLIPSDGTTEPSRADQIALARNSALDVVAGRYRGLAARLPAEQRRRLEAHHDMIRDLEQRIHTFQSITCSDPGAPDAAGANEVDNFSGLSRLIATAFSCDLTRVASLSLLDVLPRHLGLPAELDLHNDVAHHDEDPVKQQRCADFYRMHAQQLADLMDQLDSIPEGDGTLLDNTIILWGQECGGGWIHDTQHLQMLVAGGGGFRMGRYVRWGRDPIPLEEDRVRLGSSWQANELGPAHSRLLVSVARQFGLDTDQIGDVESVAYGGATHSLTGELDRLT